MKTIKKYTVPLLIFTALFCLTLFGGCASRSQSVQDDLSTEEAADIDALLGLTDYTADQSEGDTIAEDDVLKLLGVSEESGGEFSTPRKEEKTDNITETYRARPDNNRVIPETNSRMTDNRNERTENIPASATVPTRTTTAYNRSLSFQDRYSDARQLYVSRNYNSSIRAFEKLLSENMNHSLSDNCQYWIGEAYWALSNYQQSIVAFEKVFTFNKSNKEADSQLKLGLCYLRLNNKTLAEKELRKFIDNYPAHDKRSMAQRWLSDLE